MSRKGQEEFSPWKLIAAVFLGLVIIAILVVIIRDKMQAVRDSSDCTTKKGGECVSDCDAALAITEATGCTNGQVCCKKSTGSGGSGSGTRVVLPALHASSLGATVGGSRVTEDTVLAQTAVAGDKPTDSRVYTVNSRIYYYDNDDICNNVDRPDSQVCGADWHINFLLEDAGHNVLYTANFTTDWDRKNDYAIIVDETNAQKYPDTPLIRIDPVYNADTGESDKDFVGSAYRKPSPFGPRTGESTTTTTTTTTTRAATTRTAAATTTQKEAKPAGQTTTSQGTAILSDLLAFQVTVTPNQSLAGQRLHLIVNAYPNRKGTMPGLESRYDLYINMQSPIAAQGLTPQWARSKDIKVTCTASAPCSAMYFTLTDAQVCPKFDGTAAVPSAVTKHCLWVGRERGACYDTEAECDSHLPQTDGKYDAAVQEVTKTWRQNQDVARFAQMYTSIPQTSTPSPVCTPTPINSIDCTTKLCRIVTFDPQSKTGTITLDQLEMGGKYLCLYGVSGASSKLYVVQPPQRVNVDVTPPAVTAKFDPISLTIKVTCDDGVGNVSGCKDTIGVAYINDISKFPQALVKGSNNAAALCPPIRGGGAYAPMAKRQFSYSDTGVAPDSVRVLCVRGEDNAGNAGVAMVTVYNGYSMLAGALAMATN